MSGSPSLLNDDIPAEDDSSHAPSLPRDDITTDDEDEDIVLDDDVEADAEFDNDPTLPPVAIRCHASLQCIRSKTEIEEDLDEDGEPFRHLEVVGLSECANGRSCERHLNCGEQVVVGDLFRLHRCVVDSHEGGTEEAIACILVRGGAETCRCAFIPRVLHNMPIIKNNINKHVQVVDMFKASENSSKRRKNFLNCGVAGVVVLAEIPQTE
jgi:hypothetical protein